MQAAYLAGRQLGHYEAGMKMEPPGLEDAGLQQDLAEVAACAAEGTQQIVEAVLYAAGEMHAVHVLTKWAAFNQFCRETIGTEPIEVMRAFRLLEEDPEAEIRVLYRHAERDGEAARQDADMITQAWTNQFPP